jgi:putative beta-lysine N-acetyltransferase
MIPAEVHLTIDVPNHRIKLQSCGDRIVEMATAAVELATAQGLDKIWGFVSLAEWVELSRLGFVREGTIDGYFPDSPGIGVSKFLSDARARSKHTAEEDAIMLGALAQAGTAISLPPTDYRLRPATRADCEAISTTLTAVFASYPTPIDSEEAIAETMDRGACYMVAEQGGYLVSVMSADIDREHLTAEMTDCATLTPHRGRGLMQAMLAGMEDELRRQGLRSLYTLARATSAGMNIAFARLGYHYRGRFINNCHIAGDWEDMNLWVKLLAGDIRSNNYVN